MKRFITYLYDYKNGRRNKNTGFIRVDIRGKEVRLEIHICNANTCSHTGKVYLIIKKNDVVGLYISEIMLKNGIADERYVLSYLNIQNSGLDFANSIGVAIQFENGYLATNWQREECDELDHGEFLIWEPTVIHEKQEVTCQELDNQEEPAKLCLECERVVYEKMQLPEMELLPSKHRHLCTNSFLLHGFFNYQYIVRKTQIVDNEEIISIGVPGVFEQPEKMIAGMFGFMEFESLCDNEGILEKKQTNQEQKEGTFGAWFVKLTM